MSIEEVRSGAVNTAMAAYDDPVEDGEKYATATCWLNGEGYDITVGGPRGSQAIALSHADLEAVRLALERLEAMPPPRPAEPQPPQPPRRQARLLTPRQQPGATR